jgi:hypothetical protein
MAPGALARAALEHGVRAFLGLDPRLHVRQRCAQAMLDDLVSANFSKVAVGHLWAKGTAAHATTKERLEKFRVVAETCFADVILNDDPFKWSIEGRPYLRITAAVDEWGKWRADPIPGEGIYDALSLYPHPQTLAAREEIAIDEETGNLQMETDVGTLKRITSAALAAWADGMMLLVTYHGWDVPEMNDLFEMSAVLNES